MSITNFEQGESVPATFTFTDDDPYSGSYEDLIDPDATPTITVEHSDGTVLVDNQDMSAIDTGVWRYFIPTTVNVTPTGTYLVCVRCVHNSNPVKHESNFNLVECIR